MTALPLLDLVVLVVYLGLVLGISAVVAARQRTGEDYFLAARRMRSGPLALSIVANQVSAISLLGAPAFVALRSGGGLRWLQYELALPLAMLLLLAVLLPALRSVPGSSIYALAEQRFGRSVRRALAGAFLLSRGLALGVILYASALVVAEVFGIPIVAALLLLGLFAVTYTTLGGITADVWSDVLQLVVLWGGTFVAAGVVIARYGLGILHSIPEARAQTLVFDPAQDPTFNFWAMLLGGLFLYMSYYGCDQSQAQRLLAARDQTTAARALLLNGLLRFPLVLTYCAFGALLAGLLQADPLFAQSLEGSAPDRLVPVFITIFLPVGLRGLLLAAILAAAMSSIDSALNSLAAITLEDVFGRPPERQSVWLSRATSLAWGLFAVVAGLAFSRSTKGILELVNQVGSAFYGPVLAVFVLAVIGRGVTAYGALAGLASGLLSNLALAHWVPTLSWLWWNPAGFLVTAAVALAASRAGLDAALVRWPARPTAILVAAFLSMLALLAALPTMLAAIP